MRKSICYLKENSSISIVFFYILFSVLLKSMTGIDFCIPCIWKLIFGFNCPGCGLTTAFISIMELNYKNAIESNWLIFIVIPIAIYYIVKDYLKFQIISALHNENVETRKQL